MTDTPTPAKSTKPSAAEIREETERKLLDLGIVSLDGLDGMDHSRANLIMGRCAEVARNAYHSALRAGIV